MENSTDFNKECMEVITPYLTGAKKTCSYCDHLTPLILLEGEHSYITLAIGQIVEGYLQVCAQKHRTSATGFLPNERDEFVLMKQVVRLAYKEVYGNSGVAFEHGQAGTCMLNEDDSDDSLCHHTHTHFAPVNIDIRNAVKKILPDEIIVNSLNELIDVRDKVLLGGPYLYFEDSNCIGYVYPVKGRPIPRQFLRTCVALELNMKHRGDWITFPGEEFFEIGRNKLQTVLQSIYKELKSK